MEQTGRGEGMSTKLVLILIVGCVGAAVVSTLVAHGLGFHSSGGVVGGTTGGIAGGLIVALNRKKS
ncbi:MAG: hypothetical protein CL477_08110 [Acidobacteria bacterium]|nr:hypothetical protein [Acidobacteriota bacterium]